MGTFTTLAVGKYDLYETKSEVIREVMTVFREADRREFIRKDSEADLPPVPGMEPTPDGSSERAVIYTCKTANVVDRLDVMGFTLRRVREDFEVGRESELEKYESWASDGEDVSGFAAQWEFMKRLTFDDYVSGFREVMQKGLHHWDDEEAKRALSPIAQHIVDEHDDDELYWYGCPGGDARSLLRIVCEAANREGEVVQDITELVLGGYYGHDEPVCENAIRALTVGHPENATRIILTEGSSDVRILKGALDLLYPHLAPYYSFLDFESPRSQGGAPHLVTMVKSFAAAGISNRVIALFDNDTAGRDAMRILSGVTIPASIVALQYPDLPQLNNYPTLGPGGLSSMNVNGLAASIELYLGHDLLLIDGAAVPVQWKGYNEAMKAYQGEVMNKSTLHDAYERKLARCRSDVDAMKSADWTGLRAILQAVFVAFP